MTLRSAACVLLAMSLFSLAACRHPPAEQQVRQAIAKAADAARDRNADDFADVLDRDFVAPDSELDRARLAGLLRLARLRGEKVTVLMGPVDVEPRGSRYVARFTVTLGGGGRLIPEHLGVYRVETAWRLEDGDWRCYSARWKRAL